MEVDETHDQADVSFPEPVRHWPTHFNTPYDVLTPDGLEIWDVEDGSDDTFDVTEYDSLLEGLLDGVAADEESENASEPKEASEQD